MSIVGRIHRSYVHSRRVRVLCDHLESLIPVGASVLDVGTGDGLLAKLLSEHRPDLSLQGVDVLPRTESHIPVRVFDGEHLPFTGKSFDVVLFVDVLHHTKDPMVLLTEAVRIARRALVIKDHALHGLAAGLTLRAMDFVGNARHGVSLPYNYWSPGQWEKAAQLLKLHSEKKVTDLKLYPGLVDWVFGRSLHFVAQLSVPGSDETLNSRSTEERRVPSSAFPASA